MVWAFFFVVVVVVVVFLQNSIPFAVIGSNVQVESKGRKFRGRVYPWGVVEGITPSLLILILLFFFFFYVFWFTFTQSLPLRVHFVSVAHLAVVPFDNKESSMMR